MKAEPWLNVIRHGINHAISFRCDDCATTRRATVGGQQSAGYWARSRRRPAVLLVMSLRRGPFDLPNVGADSCVVATGGACADGARCGAETLSESARKMRVVAKAAGVGNIAERVTCLHQCAAFDQMRRMIETERAYVVAARRAADREQLLQIAQRDSRLGGHFARRDVRVGKTVLDDAADPREQFVVVT